MEDKHLDDVATHEGNAVVGEENVTWTPKGLGCRDMAPGAGRGKTTWTAKQTNMENENKGKQMKTNENK